MRFTSCVFCFLKRFCKVAREKSSEHWMCFEITDEEWDLGKHWEVLFEDMFFWLPPICQVVAKGCGWKNPLEE